MRSNDTRSPALEYVTTPSAVCLSQEEGHPTAFAVPYPIQRLAPGQGYGSLLTWNPPDRSRWPYTPFRQAYASGVCMPGDPPTSSETSVIVQFSWLTY